MDKRCHRYRGHVQRIPRQEGNYSEVLCQHQTRWRKKGKKRTTPLEKLNKPSLPITELQHRENGGSRKDFKRKHTGEKLRGWTQLIQKEKHTSYTQPHDMPYFKRHKCTDTSISDSTAEATPFGWHHPLERQEEAVLRGSLTGKHEAFLHNRSKYFTSGKSNSFK